MKRLLKSPAFNAVCIDLFTAFYATVFFTASKNNMFKNNATYQKTGFFWPAWSGFLANGHQRYIVYVLTVVTIVITVLLIARRQPYDEYHISILLNCLVAAIILTLTAIAIFYLMILIEPAGIAEKFTFFIFVHWTTVVFADLAFVLLCRLY